MSDIILRDNHTTLATADHIKQICQPLFSLLGITHFAFNRYYESGARIRLSTSADWTAHYYNQTNYYKISKFERSFKLYKTGYSLWDYWEENEQTALIRKDLRDNYNLNHGLAIVKIHNKYMDMFNLATNHGNRKINNVYLNNLPLIEKWLDYFLIKAEKFIKEAEKNPIVIKPDTTIFYQDDGTGLIRKSEKEEQFLEQLYLDQIASSHTKFANIISKRENDCLQGLLEGKTAKEIARKLKLSPRTIEFYISNLKKKTGHQRISNLIADIFQQQTST